MMMKYRFFAAVLLLFLANSALALTTIGNPAETRRAKESLLNLARDKQDEADKAREALRYVKREPYIPQQYDYGTEMGTAFGDMTYYSVGASIGFHMGTCIFSKSETCQQYTDLIFNVNGRDSHTHYLGMGSLRWQWVNFPSAWSPMARVLAGANNQITPGSVKQYFIYGVGFGVTTYLHPKADVRLEYRLFQAERVYGQVMFSVQFKMERWVEYFAEKLKDIGVGTASVTGTVLKTTVETTGTVVKGAAETTGAVVGGAAGVVGGAASEVGNITGIKKKEKKPEEPKQSAPKK